MDATIHGHVRVYDRTKMLPDDVLFLIANDKVVSLGFSGTGQEFLVFYSPADRDCKIAITADNRTSLLSIWEKDFDVPSSVRYPTRRDFYQAQCKVVEFIATETRKIKKVEVAPKEIPSACVVQKEEVLVAKIVLRINKENIFEQELGNIPKKECGTPGQAAQIFSKPLKRIIGILEEVFEESDNSKYSQVEDIMCSFYYYKVNGRRAFSNGMKLKNLKKLLRAA